jgi:broad-specificity NMP kinase
LIEIIYLDSILNKFFTLLSHRIGIYIMSLILLVSVTSLHIVIVLVLAHQNIDEKMKGRGREWVRAQKKKNIYSQ